MNDTETATIKAAFITAAELWTLSRNKPAGSCVFGKVHPGGVVCQKCRDMAAHDLEIERAWNASLNTTIAA